MTVYKDDGQWRYRKVVKLPDRTKVRISGTPEVNTKAAAETAERAHIEVTLNPPPVSRDRHLMTAVLDRFMTEYVPNANNKPSSVKSKQGAVDRYLKPELGDLYLDEVRAPAIAALTVTLRQRDKGKGAGKLGAKTIKDILQTLRKCLRWAVEMELIDAAPKVAMPKIDEEEMRFLSDDELAALLEAARTEPAWHLAILLGADAGLRRGEIRAARWTDYSEVTAKITVSRSRWNNIETTPKSRKPRLVPTSNAVRAALHANRETRLRGPYLLSRTKDGHPIGAEYMYEALDRLCRKAKITPCGWHVLRHTFCTRLAMRGAPVMTIKDLAGHASLATTMRYMHVVQGALDSAVALLNVPTVRQLEKATG